MGADYKAILEQEIAALKREMISYSDPKRREAAQKCYEIIAKPLYAPKTYVDIVQEVAKIISETLNASNLRAGGETSLANLIIFRTALVLPLFLENAQKALPEFYEYIKVQDDAKLDMYINNSGSTAEFLSRVQAHRAPLDLLVNKAVRIQGDPFEEMVVFARKLELNLKRYRKEGALGPASADTGDPVPDAVLPDIAPVHASTLVKAHDSSLVGF